jgi:peptidoglycan hydrolase CwlO-like protein
MQDLGVDSCVEFGIAYGDEISDAQSSVDAASAQLSAAQTRLNEISNECDVLSQEISDLQTQIDEAVAQILNAQSEMLAGRQMLSDVAVSEYKSSTVTWAISTLVRSESLSDIIKEFRYANEVMEYYSSEIARQKELRQTFIDLSDNLNQQKNSQEEKWNQLQQNLNEAYDLVSQASTNLQLSEAQLNSLIEQQAKIQSQAAQTAESAALNVSNTSDTSTEDSGSTPSSDASVSGGDSSSAQGGGESSTESSSASTSTAPSTSSSASTATTTSSSSSVQWFSGIASAYGGSSDPYTPNPGTTATGAICDDTSMGVAIPMSLPNYRSYFGRTVEISYNGMTVYAVVNDCGYMSGGSRVLDLQPGVFKAFGYSTCQAWGIRNVSYRFL